MYSFGVTGNGQKEFYAEMEEIITDSPIAIETEHLIKIVQGYSEIDLGSPVFYSMFVEKMLHRGMDTLSPTQITSIAKYLSKATNTQNGGFGWYAAMEKHLKNELH